MIKTPNQITVITHFRRHTHLAALAPPTNGVWNLLGGATVVVTMVLPAPSTDLVEVVRRRFRCRPSPWLPGLWGGPGGGWVCLLGRMGDGATSSRQVMAVLSSQGRGDGGTLPSLFNNGTAGNKTDVHAQTSLRWTLQVEQLQPGTSECKDTGPPVVFSVYVYTPHRFIH